MNKVLKIDEKDNVVTCLKAIKKGEIIKVDGKDITVNEDIGRFHIMWNQQGEEGTSRRNYEIIWL